MNTRLLFVHALSPLHAGTGQGVGVIDLPIAREQATGLPYLPGSSLKGTLRDRCDDQNTREKVFGPETDNAEEFAGAAQFSDQRLLLLPVRSLSGTFAWVTSPYILRRLLRDAGAASVTGMPQSLPALETQEQCLVTDKECVILVDSNRVILEDLDLVASSGSSVAAWAEWVGQRVFPGDADWQRMLAGRFCVVHDDVLSFLLDTATEITARIRLQEDMKTVQQGGLWYEEALPTETILSGLIAATPVKKTGATDEQIFQSLAKLMETPTQFGGKATVGRGLCRLQMPGKEA
jgi:CRISPR-associated protein Cmr4